jgi:hypothetical protein
MSRTWTRRRAISAPPASGPRFSRASAAAAIALSFLAVSCHGSNTSENHIRPIRADLQIQNPYTGSPDPAVYMDKGSTSGDLVTVHIKLRAGAAPITFDAFTLELTYDSKVIQIGDVFEVNPDVLGSCHGQTPCDPLCLDNAAEANQGHTVDQNGKAHFVMGVSARYGCPAAKTGRCKGMAITNRPCLVDAECLTGETCSLVADTTLLTLAFIAASAIQPPGSRIELFTNPDSSKHGDCEILNGVVDLPIPCEDGNAFMTASH